MTRTMSDDSKQVIGNLLENPKSVDMLSLGQVILAEESSLGSPAERQRQKLEFRSRTSEHDRVFDEKIAPFITEKLESRETSADNLRDIQKQARDAGGALLVKAMEGDQKLTALSNALTHLSVHLSKYIEAQERIEFKAGRP